MKDEAGHSIVWFSSNGAFSMVNRERESLVNEIRSYCVEKYNSHNISEAVKNHSEDEKLQNDWSENLRLQEIEKMIDAGVPVEFEIIGGSIKDHKDYTDKNGITYKQTVVTRCKIDNWKMIA